MQTHCKITIGLLVAGLLFTVTPAATAQTTTKVKSKPNKGTVIKEKTEDGQKTKIKADEDGVRMKSNDPKAMSGTTLSGQPVGVMVGGAMMTRARDIVDNAALSQDHTTLVAAVKQAGLVQTLKGAGPFTVFAPTNAAFSKLPTGTLENLMMPQGSTQLTAILTYHVVPGRFTAADLKDGQVLTTVQGQTLTVMRSGNQLMLRDGKGMTVNVTTPDVISSNGVTHVVDGVLMPTM